LSAILKYTTSRDISLRLQGRIHVSDSPFNRTAAMGEVSDELIDSVGIGVEAKIDLALSQIYKLPIPCEAIEAREIIRSIVEKLVIAEIGITHFRFSLDVTENGSGMSFVGAIRKQAIEELQSILYGHGIYLPGIMQPPSIGVNYQPIVLKGVPLLAESEQPNTVTRNFVGLEKKDVDRSIWF
jgi:hypothetical protein